jgi:molybdopterin-guanine dinucleotide biosynthesis protein B
MGYAYSLKLPHIVCLVGPSGAGKTTLVEKLVPVIEKRGLRVATVKHHHGARSLDLPGKDSYRHMEAGARAVVLAARDRLAVFVRLERDEPLEVLVARHLAQAHVVLAEGFKNARSPKIEVLGARRRPALSHETGLVAVVGRPRTDPGVPVFEPGDVSTLAEFISRCSMDGGAVVNVTFTGPAHPDLERFLAPLAAALGPGEIQLLFRAAAGTWPKAS